jgi:tRNA(Ile)-lysidine synthase
VTARTASPYSPEALVESLQRLGSSCQIVIAVSGGADSAAVLAAASHLPNSYRVRALHIDHGLPGSPRLRQAAEDAARHCRVPLNILAVTVRDAETLGLEAAARQARYAAFASALVEGEDLIAAHHRDDQGETLLLQLLRGAGARGLAAMPAVSVLGQGRLLRPVLDLPREALRTYAAQAKVPWTEDPSNADTALDRNYLRQVVWPALLARWPGAPETLSRSAAHLGDTLQLLDAEIAPRLAAIETPEGLSLDGLARLTPSWRREVVRAWLRRLGVPAPSTRRLAQLDAQFLESAPDTQPVLSLPAADLRRHDGYLVLQPRLPALVLPDLAALPADGVVTLPGLGMIRVSPGGEASLRSGAYRLASRAGGERWRSGPGGMTRALKDGLREARIAPWVRERVVLVWAGDVLAAVVLPHETWIASDWRTPAGQRGLSVRWEGAPSALLGRHPH